MNQKTTRAFTLIELLVVLGLVVLFSAAVGLTLQEGQPAGALQAGQSLLAGLVAKARGYAVLHQRRAMLVVEADAAGESFLRRIHVVLETTPGSGRWQGLNDTLLLPGGIYVVPGSAGVDGAIFPGGTDAWPVRRRSSLQPAGRGSVTLAPGEGAAVYLEMSAPLAASGVPGTGGNRFVLAMAQRTAAGVEFAQAEAVRGIVLSSYGAVILINEATGFDF
jgi:prepilin-type N-terminal cleavage/methylation domain-containing protein